MKTLKIVVVTTLLTLMCIAQGCKKANETASSSVSKTEQQTDTLQSSTEPIGFYVSEGYAEREKGADWVSIKVTRTEDNLLQIELRSRSDIKKPTCTFDGIAKQKEENIYVVEKEGKNILFTFSQSNVNISTEKEEDKDLLYFFCSGGATMAGKYEKTTELEK